MKKDKQYWITKFEAFLKENNCYEEFEINTKKYYTDISFKDVIKNTFYTERIYDFVACAFCWDNERFDFWDKLDDKWRAICENDL